MLTQSFDAVVIGAGSVGLPTACFLADAGVSTLVVDQFAGPGQGSNKAAIGGVRATHSTPKIRLCLDSIRIFSTWEQVHGDRLGRPRRTPSSPIASRRSDRSKTS
jgi:sarcosine oxidase subunit beta